MKDPFWPEVRKVFAEMDRIYELPQKFRTTSDAMGKPKVVAESVDLDKLFELRRQVRTQLEYLKSRLGEFLTEREVYLVLFALVVYFDEMVTFHVSPEVHTKWQPLQKELYGIQNGGEVFYETVDDLLRKPDTHSYVYQIYYYVLSRGFQGKYVDSPVKLEEYKKQLQSKIPLPSLEQATQEEEVLELYISSPWEKLYPLFMVLTLALFYGCLYVLANL